jgi:hypothetical protein
MARYPEANRFEKTSSCGPSKMFDPIYGVLLHITDGVAGKLGELRYLKIHFDTSKKSAHFAVAKSGEIWQFVDTDITAWALGGGWQDKHWISVENFALPHEELTAGQLHSLARLYAWLVVETGIPLRSVDVARSVADFDSGKEQGLGGHSMYRDPLRTECPGAAILAQRPMILAQAKAILGR